MNKQAQVGLFTILGLVAIFAVFFVLADFGTRSQGYKVGVHFPGASGLRNAAVVYLSGVPIGAVDQISLLPDYTTEVVLAIKSEYAIPQGSRFLIQAPLTGEPSVLIEPPKNLSTTIATLPREVAPIDQQPRGTNPTSISDLLEQGQGEVRRLDDILAQLQKSEPQLLAKLTSTLDNANALTTNANRSLTQVTGEVQQLAASLQKNLTVASGNVADLTGSLDDVVKRDSGQVDTLLAQLTRTSRSFGETVDSLRDVATNPKVKNNLIDTTRDFALTAKTFAELTQDLRNITGDPQTQNQLRDTVAQLDATSQKVDSLVGSLGGSSKVYGVDKGATPAPFATPTPPGFLPTSMPAIPLPGTSASPAASSSVPGSTSGAAPGSGPAVTTAQSNNIVGALRSRVNQFTKDLVELQVRVGQLSPERSGSANTNVSPLLTADRGPQSDFNLFILPRAHTGLEAGVNDVGSNGTSTANFMLLNRSSGFTYGGGIEYSRLGVTTSVAGKAFGFEARAYDLRHPTLDTYLNLFAAPKLQVFGGERDLSHVSRRTVFGLQFEF
jgi:phospholipid/cholesterol/gamma-HCH transport system substrate-binding protein